MPLFVFLVLGLLQLGLLHQARLLTKYAAFKAVRVGAIHNAKMEAMKRAALAVMLPMTGKRNNYGGGQGMYYNASGAKFAMSWGMAKGGVSKDTPAGLQLMGTYGIPAKDARELVAHYRRLPKTAAKIKMLEQELQELRAMVEKLSANTSSASN